AAELVVGDDDHRVLRARGGHHGVDELDEVVGPRVLARVARVLVLRPDRLDEADRLELAGLRGALRARQELRLVTQVLRAHRRARGERGEVVERLVVVLEELAGAVRVHRSGRGAGIGARAGRRAVGPAGTADVP